MDTPEGHDVREALGVWQGALDDFRIVEIEESIDK